MFFRDSETNVSERHDLGISPSEPVEMTYEDGPASTVAPGGDKYSGLDAFGRVVETRWKKASAVKQQVNYGYDRASNRTWRRNELAHTLSNGEEDRHGSDYYDNDQWRAVEEYKNSETSPDRRYLWGLRSRWDLVKRLHDATGALDEKRYVLYDAMDPVAICDETGAVKLRFEYSPFGEVTFLDQDFVPVSASSGSSSSSSSSSTENAESWNWLFHGEFRDETRSLTSKSKIAFLRRILTLWGTIQTKRGRRILETRRLR